MINKRSISRRAPLGQVFLKDENKKLQICKALDMYLANGKEDIMEIGVGEGDMTKTLLENTHFNNYYGLELDEKYFAIADKKFKEEIELRLGDFLKEDFENLSRFVLYSNVPYQITTKFIEKCLHLIEEKQIPYIAITIQREAYERIMKGENEVFFTFKNFFKMEKKLKINRECFSPVPGVDSIFSIWSYKENLFNVSSVRMISILNLIANKRNKTIKNCLKVSAPQLIEKPETKWLMTRFFKLNEREQNEAINFFNERIGDDSK